MSLTLLYFSSCTAVHRCGTQGGCPCPGGQRRLRSFLLSVGPGGGQSVGAAPAARASFCPIALQRRWRGSALQCSPVPGSGPRGEAVQTSPISGGLKCCLLQRVPGHPGDNGAVLVTDPSWEESVSCWEGCRGCSSVAECLLRMWEVLGSIPSISKGGVSLIAQPQAGIGWSWSTGPVLSRHCGPALPSQGLAVG